MHVVLFSSCIVSFCSKELSNDIFFFLILNFFKKAALFIYLYVLSKGWDLGISSRFWQFYVISFNMSLQFFNQISPNTFILWPNLSCRDEIDQFFSKTRTHWRNLIVFFHVNCVENIPAQNLDIKRQMQEIFTNS